VKNIVLTGFGDITLLDLDTIDLSNLNRQFLFRKKDVKQSKALVGLSTIRKPISDVVDRFSQVAAQTVKDFNPHIRITPIHANIKEPQFDLDWFQSFDIVLNALDNLG
jgi:ubiquitin-like 1-activating enzyme E1 B